MSHSRVFSGFYRWTYLAALQAAELITLKDPVKDPGTFQFPMLSRLLRGSLPLFAVCFFLIHFWPTTVNGRNPESPWMVETL